MKCSKIFLLIGFLSGVGGAVCAGGGLEEYFVNSQIYPLTTKYLPSILDSQIVSDIEGSMAAFYIEKKQALETKRKELGLEDDPRPHLREYISQENYDVEEYKKQLQKAANFVHLSDSLKKVQEKLDCFVDFKKLLVEFSKAVEEDTASYFRFISLDTEPNEESLHACPFTMWGHPLQKRFFSFQHLLTTEIKTYYMWDTKYESESWQEKNKEPIARLSDVMQAQLTEQPALQEIFNKDFLWKIYRGVSQDVLLERNSPEKMREAKRVVEEFARPFFEAMELIQKKVLAKNTTRL